MSNINDFVCGPGRLVTCQKCGELHWQNVIHYCNIKERTSKPKMKKTWHDILPTDKSIVDNCKDCSKLEFEYDKYGYVKQEELVCDICRHRMTATACCQYALDYAKERGDVCLNPPSIAELTDIIHIALVNNATPKMVAQEIAKRLREAK